MILKNFLRELDRICPFNYQEDFDNSGLQVGDENSQCQSLLLAFDFTEEVLEEAIKKHNDTIITHHPFLFNAIKQVHTQNWQGKMIYQLIKNNIALVALHTNLDKIDYGVNMKLAADIGLIKTEVLLPEENGCGLGAIGDLPSPLPLADLIPLIKEKLGQPCLKFTGNKDKIIKRVAMVGGAGAEFLDTAQEKGADLYLSSDFKYHDAQKSQNIEMPIIDAGHFGTEAGVIPALAEKLKTEFPELNIQISENMKDYWQYI